MHSVSPAATRISVVVPNFNSGPVLRRALESILNQTHRNFELILVDSLSTDESASIVEEYRERVRVCIREKDTGHANGLNKGFRHATGDVFCWLCADDELKPQAFETVARIFSERPDIDLVTGGCERVFDDGTRGVTIPPANALDICGYIDVLEQPSTFWRAELHRRIGPIGESYYLIFDWELWCRMKEAGARALAIPDILSVYYFSQDNKTSKAGRLFAVEARQLIRRYGPLGGALGEIYWFLFRHFDMHGCYDSPPTCARWRGDCHWLVMTVLNHTIGKELANRYNWHFAAMQARGLQWW